MFAFAGAAHAAALPFDPEQATRAWLATMGPEATQRSNAYFEGGYIIEYVGAAIGILIGQRWGIRDIADPAGLPLIMLLFAVIGLVTAPMQRNLTRFNEHQADMFGLNVARAPDGFAEAAVLLSEYRKMEPSPIEEILFYTHPSGWNRVHNAMVWKANEIAAGRLENTPGGPPQGWRPDFVVRSARPENASRATPAPEPSPAAPSD